MLRAAAAWCRPPTSSWSDLFRARGELAPALLRKAASTEYRADCVVVHLADHHDPGRLTRDAEQRALIEQLTADKAIAVAREPRIADADQEKLYEQLQAKDRALRAAVARAAGNAAELARIRTARDRIAAERQALIAALAQRDQALAAEVRAYREVVTGIATSPDVRKQKALQRFAAGEQREALRGPT